jgi:hypothetical protein
MSPLSQRLSDLRSKRLLWALLLTCGFWLGDIDGLEVGQFGPETGDRAAADRNDGMNENDVKGFQRVKMREPSFCYAAVVNGQTVKPAHVGKMKQAVIRQVSAACDLKVFQFRQPSQVLETIVSDARAGETEVFYFRQSGQTCQITVPERIARSYKLVSESGGFTPHADVKASEFLQARYVQAAVILVNVANG